MSRFGGRVAVVTGASSGVGRALALALAAEGATVWLLGRKPEALSAVAGAVRERGGAPAVVHPMDITADGDVGALADRLARQAGRADILVHAAGVIGGGPVGEAPVAGLDAQYLVNLRAPYLLTQRLLLLLVAARGQIVFVNSSAGLAGRGGVAQYAATKHGLRALADSLRDEVNDRGVRVLSVFLGRTATPMQASLHAAERRAYHPEGLIQPDDVASVVLAALALPPTAEVTDLTIRPLRKPAP